jgi:hypothetical protein
MNNKIETQELNIEITLDEMQLLQDDELKTICGGNITNDGDNGKPECRLQK